MTEGGSELPRGGQPQALVRIPTVSYREPERIDTAAFDAFVDELATQFPLLHERLELTRVHTHGLLSHWRGADSRRPLVLMAHLDVVLVEGTDRTGFATGMTNATKTVGGAIASSVFAICLASTGSIKDPVKGHAPRSGYLTVWAICAVAALVAAVALGLMPRPEPGTGPSVTVEM